MLKLAFKALAALQAVVVAIWLALPVEAQSLNAVARIDPLQSTLSQTSDGAALVLHLSQPVPFRVFTLETPNRLVLDFREVNWTGLKPSLADAVPDIAAMRFGLYRPGWSRLVLDLNAPLTVSMADMDTGQSNGAARLTLILKAATPAEYAARAGAPEGALWPERKRAELPAKTNALRIAIDPGHGGIDPGAVREGVEEKGIALDFAHELKRALEIRGDFEVMMTRTQDEFLSLRERVLTARDAQADLFLSLHANTVTRGNPTGATVYLLSDDASDKEAAALAEKENRADILGGVALDGEEDAVARILVDLARGRTNMRSRAFGDHLVQGLKERVGVIKSRPLRAAGFEVLKAPEIPSVLLELGFLSNAQDRENMQSPTWRARAIEGVLEALDAWRETDAAQNALNLK